nr:tetratricopeptide repeat protein [Candidatus Cloacimonadota bacterium]
MKNLVPHLIADNYRDHNFSGNYNAVTMFIDISGFTAMTQNLVRNGKEGAEILTEIINKIFTPSIDLIYKNNGFISSFAGDAFTSIFPENVSGIAPALRSALEIQKIFSMIGLQTTKFGIFELKVKIGLSFGNVEWRIINTEKSSNFFFRGEPINRAANCEHQANIGEVIIDEHIYQKANGLSTKKIGEEFYLVSRVKREVIKERKLRQLTDEDITPFVPYSIRYLKSKGEFRNVISCFISFQQKDNFFQKLAKILQFSNEYGGYFNKIDFGDKGGVILVLFGAPILREKIEIRACDFALSVNQIKNFNCRIGLTSGIAFTGFIGSNKREEYTALGMAVNLSARYMMKANWSEIFTDRFIYEKVKDNYNIHSIGDLQFKGFLLKISTFKLVKKKEHSTTFITTGEFVGRQEQLQLLSKYIKPLSGSGINRFGGIIYIRGAAGSGKSRLVKEFKMNLDRDDYRWIYLPCDAILRKSFNPLIYFLNGYFEQSDENSSQTNKRRFEKIFAALIDNSPDETLKKEMIRTKSFLGAMLNHFWKNSLYEQLDAKTRYKNTLFALKTLFNILALLKPVVMEFEDSNWIDEDTINFLQVLVRHEENYTLIIITSCRDNDDKTNFSFGLSDVQEKSIQVSNFDRSESRDFIHLMLTEKVDIPVPDDTFKLIWEKSNGNPFFIEQIIFFLRDKNIFDQDLHLKERNFQIPENINSLIIARIDKLNPELKNVTKNASVLGNKFSGNVLNSMIGEESIEDFLIEGEKERLWSSVSDFDHMFNNSFIRESVYELILKKELRGLHKLAGDSYETLFKSDLKHHYSDLAYNYNKAEIDEKAVFYLEKAGDYEKEMYHNHKALNFYDELIKLLSKVESGYHQMILKMTLNKIELYLNQSNTKDAKRELAKLKVEDILNQEARDRFYYLTAKIFTVTENFVELKKYIESIIEKVKTSFFKNHLNIYYLDTLRYLNEIAEFEQRSKELLEYFHKNKEHVFEGMITNIIGIFYLQKSKYKDALKYFQMNYEIVKKDNNKMLINRVLHNIGIVWSRLGNRKKAMGYYRDSLKIAEEIGNKNAYCKISSDIATILTSEGKYDDAIEYYSDGLEIAKMIGNKMQEELILFNIGLAYHYNGKYEKSITFLVESKKICEKISDKIGITYA